MKILFIDDDITALEIIKVNCKINNIDADYLQKPELIKEINLHQYDLIITDYMMPKMSGFDLIRYCQKAKPQLFFAVITAISKYEIIKEAYDLNIVDYILKPINFPNIQEVIEKVEDRIKRLKEEKHFLSKLNKLALV